MYTYLKQLLLIASIYDGWTAPPALQSATFQVSVGQQHRLCQSSGPYEIGVHIQELIDPSRLDPWAYLDNDRSSGPVNRAVMISTYYPTAIKHPNDDDDDDDSKPPLYTTPYMPVLTAAIYDAQVFAQLGLNSSFTDLYSSAHINGPILHVPAEPFPVLLFSSGGGASRFFYTALAEALASTGYIVACIDHSHDSLVVELLNHTLLHGGLPVNGNRTLLMMDLDARVQDTRFALDELSRLDVLEQHFATSDEVFNVSRVGMVGHSLGGATMSTAMLLDSRIAAGVSLDGVFFGPELEAGLDRPFLILGAEGHDSAKEGWWSTWPGMWPKIRAWKKQLNVKGTGHASFSDVPLIIDVLDIRKDMPDPDGEVDNWGTISGARMLEVQTAYVTAFFDRFLKGKSSKLLEGAAAEFPEVDFIM
ncbi:hypothetical protein MMC34_006176 [Xylographa carneopallida]|nr:hypothetical protein [Xylographa carneopallida]